MLTEAFKDHVTDVYHPFHSCGHVRASKQIRHVVMRYIPLRLKSIARILLEAFGLLNLFRALQTNFRKKGNPKILFPDSDNQEIFLHNQFNQLIDICSPFHFCKHSSSFLQQKKNIVNRIYRKSSFSSRQKVKRFLPRNVIRTLKAKALN